MRLDTLHLMTAAIALYRRFGFTEIAPYHERALPGMRYFSKSLSVRSAE
jgi:ribosomal protein S18 acetylase RimI-like enzyme